jgi:hypothetical protein
MTNYIVSTTINAVTAAIEKYDFMEGWKLVVAGDLKTPKDYRLENGVYLSPEAQENLDKELSDLIGWNCIQRRNMSMLYAVKNGANLIALIDDDNIPLENWGKEIFVNKQIKVKSFDNNAVAFDPVGAAGELKLWHRGFPLELISSRDYAHVNLKTIVPSVQANFWNGDPDIDALCRLEHMPNVTFDTRKFPFTSGSLSPFNSQNTIVTSEVIGEYFLFPFVGRMDDIWASYYLGARGSKIIYHEPTVFQARNEHNLIEDMKKEYLGYENNLSIVKDLARDADSIINYLPERTIAAWDRFKKVLFKK